MMVQCRMEQQQDDGIAVTVGYIDESAAKVGMRVELKGEDGLWTVTTVSNHKVDKKYIVEKQAKKSWFKNDI
jgi:hypothetical protein